MERSPSEIGEEGIETAGASLGLSAVESIAWAALKNAELTRYGPAGQNWSYESSNDVR
jgi:hypothetical protein